MRGLSEVQAQAVPGEKGKARLYEFLHAMTVPTDTAGPKTVIYKQYRCQNTYLIL